MSSSPGPRPRLHAPTLFVVLVLLQAWLVANPGYFSHDELQWGARADVASVGGLPWERWTAVDVFQWRPLTFNLWLLASFALFDTPQAMHLAWVLAGSSLALALAALLLRLGARPATARAAAVVFALGPYAAYVHGWVATMADLLWVGAALALAHSLLALHRRGGSAWAGATLAFVLTAAGLLAKEAALAIPGLLALVAVLHRGGPVGPAAVLGSGLAALAYLGLRLDTLLAPGEATTYSLAPAAAPGNWAAYWLYLLRTSTLEVGGTWRAPGLQLAVAAGLLLAMLAAVARPAPRLALALVLGGSLALAPALPLAFPANQYGYGFWAWVVCLVALAWPSLGRAGRALVLLLALASTWHGINVQRGMHRAGELQAAFQPALAAALAGHAGELRLRTPERDDWLYRRLGHQVPAWRGQPIGDRVRWVAPGEDADYAVNPDGSLQPLR